MLFPHLLMVAPNTFISGASRWPTEEELISDFQANQVLQSDFRESAFFLKSESSEKCWLEGMARVFNPAMRNALMEFETKATEAAENRGEQKKEEPQSPSTPQTDDFNPKKCGGVELCIVVSYAKAGKRDQLKLAKMLKNKAWIRKPKYGDPLE